MSIDSDPYTPIDSRTKLVGLLGQPLGHSFSPAMHNRAFHVLNLNYCYLPIEVADADLEAVTTGMARMPFAGYNVTIPHKMRIMDCLDTVDPLAQAIGAVNTVTLRHGHATGYNTDGIGFVQSLETEGALSAKDKAFMILGCGGAARAIAMTLAQQGASQLIICNRTEEKAHALADDVNRQGRPCCEAIPMQTGAMQKWMRKTDILVNTTSVGMHPQEDRSPVEDQLLQSNLVVCDIVYNPHQTRLLQDAHRKGCATVGGLGMLVYQGAAGFKLWTGREAPIDEMFAAIRP